MKKDGVEPDVSAVAIASLEDGLLRSRRDFNFAGGKGLGFRLCTVKAIQAERSVVLGRRRPVLDEGS